MPDENDLMHDEGSFPSIGDSDDNFSVDDLEVDADDDEISDEELDEILGRSSARKRTIVWIAGVGALLVIAGWILFGGGAEIITGGADLDSLDVAAADSVNLLVEAPDSLNLLADDPDLEKETSGQPQEKDDSATTTLKESPKELVQDIEDMAISEFDTSDGLIFDDFYYVINAQVSSEEMGELADDDFEAMLFEPLIPSKKMPITARTEQTLREWIAARTREIEDVPADTTRFLNTLDSLKKILNAKESDLFRAHRDRKIAEDKLDKLTNVADSVRSFEMKKLAKIIQAMKPFEAALMLEDKTSVELVEVLFRVKPRSAAQILEQLPPEIGAEVAAKIMKQ